MSMFSQDFQSVKFYIFDNLPTLETCCFCMNLKIGCMIIGVVYILFVLEAFGSITFSSEYSQCYFAGAISTFIGCSAGLVCLVTAVSAGLFLYGVSKEQYQFHIPFMYTTLLLVVFNLATSVVSTFTKSCARPYLFGGATFAGAVLLIYCLLIVNSHYKKSFAQGPSSASRAPSSSTTPRSNDTPKTVLTAETNTEPTAFEAGTTVPSFESGKSVKK
ncbi:unnamed protein product [Spodoptera littoralis]|uniref:Uncharacterized protein n=1 Tax=Spodoptera littoralis TaxID=7109 RepID=A0A9P0HW67_SPOLI|nr:unnamed protein product [Spodoptera littoralis]CAH1635647.1 unnamed protein product [Spodoptera littoralis]